MSSGVGQTSDGRVDRHTLGSHRSHVVSALLAVSSLVAVGVLLNAIGSPSRVVDALGRAQWGWVAAALAVSLLTNIPYAVALKGTVSMPIPLRPTTELELATTYMNVVVPVLGGTVLQVRFLQRHGVELPAAIAAGGLLSAAGALLTELPIFLAAVWLSPNAIRLGHVPVTGMLELGAVVVVVLAVVIVVAFELKRVRHAAMRPMMIGLGTIWTAMRSPRQVALIAVGKFAATLLYGLCLLLCLQAFGATLSYWTVLALSIGISSVAAIIPLPGGNTGAGALGLAGALVALGLPASTAVPVSLVSQLTVNYIPSIPGWVATRHLLRQLI
jgi:uncharacterized membrane protein YbhN (UPF0104 family)